MRREEVMRSRYLASQVERYHTWPTLNRETVADHTYGVLRVYREIWGLHDVETVYHIMDHDLPELHTGDLPYPAKIKTPSLGAGVRAAEAKAKIALGLCDYRLPEAGVATRVKIADLLQMWEFCRREQHMGNAYAVDMVQDTLSNAMTLAEGLGVEDHAAVTRWIDEQPS